MVTDIDLGKLTNASNAGPILKALLQPDVASRDLTPIELSGAVHRRRRLERAGQSRPTGRPDAAHHARLGARRAERDRSTALASQPDTDGQLRLQNPSRGFDALFMRVQHRCDRATFHDERPWPDAATAAARRRTRSN